MITPEDSLSPFCPVKSASFESFQVEIECLFHGSSVELSVSRHVSKSKCREAWQGGIVAGSVLEEPDCLANSRRCNRSSRPPNRRRNTAAFTFEPNESASAFITCAFTVRSCGYIRQITSAFTESKGLNRVHPMFRAARTPSADRKMSANSHFCEIGFPPRVGASHTKPHKATPKPY